MVSLVKYCAGSCALASCALVALLVNSSAAADHFPIRLSSSIGDSRLPANPVVRNDGWGPPRARTVVDTQRDFDAFTPIDCRMPGEFEHQTAILLACNELIATAPELVVDLVRATWQRVHIIAIVSTVEQYNFTIRLLQDNAVPWQHLHFVEIDHDTMWARDYGPVIVKARDGRPIVVDADYDVGRTKDDQVPDQFAQLVHLDIVRVPLRIDGGNLISNGAGLALTTSRLVDESGTDVDSLTNLIGQCYGIRQLAILEPLLGEATGHVDMFATFTSKNTVVIGSYRPESDAENAAILDRNANRLAKIQTADGPLRVVRIPMPAHDDGVFRSYTNVVFANDALLVPTYSDADEVERQNALDLYARLNPRRQVVGVDASRIIESNGALHCITMNLGPLGRIPFFPRPRTHGNEPMEVIDGNAVSLLLRAPSPMHVNNAGILMNLSRASQLQQLRAKNKTVIDAAIGPGI